MKTVTHSDIQKINRLYLQLKTYAAVSRATGFAPTTVKKYIIPNFVEVDESSTKKFEGPLPEFNPSIFRKDDWGDLCVLSEEEIEEIKDLWKEMEL